MRMLESVAVVIPARNEQALIARCLESIAVSIEYLAARSDVGSTVTVIADGCTDRTAEIARQFEFVHVFETSPVGVGAARHLGSRRAIAEFGLPLESLWLAHTDADSEVAPAWLHANVGAAAGGAQLRVGAVQPDFADLSAEQVAAWIRTHPRGAAAGHVHGANLGIRASIYRAVSGFHPLALHEDADLVDRVQQHGGPISVSVDPDVLTSGRVTSRIHGGYATYLHQRLGDNVEA